jgi:hypothetical protein
MLRDLAGSVKVLDFGLAKQQAPAGTDSDATRTQEALQLSTQRLSQRCGQPDAPQQVSETGIIPQIVHARIDMKVD